jgi:peptidoglycan/xylan/chitin deacetylase (PgdA/CDA1 family)
VTILLYHRISNTNIDSVTVKPSQFSQHLIILKRDYELIDMTEFLANRDAPRRKPAVIITFDDGYEDNFQAAKMLRDAGIPCTFFICTGIVGTEKSFPMDLRLKRWLPTLSWNQVIKMSSWGFHIANHSVNHVDMGQLEVADSLKEIHSAARDIAHRLGEKGPENWLAYPFGRLQNMKRELAEQFSINGVDFCFSAYGGVNQPDFDPHDIRRQPVNHKFSDLMLHAVVAGYRVRHQ